MNAIVHRHLCHVVGIADICAGRRRRALRLFDTAPHMLNVYTHNPDRQVFERTITWLLRKGFCFVSQAEVSEYLQKGEVPSKRLAWLSLDDGWEENRSNVLPFLQKHGIPATIFIAPAESQSQMHWPAVAGKFQDAIGLTVEQLLQKPNKRRVELVRPFIQKAKETLAPMLMSKETIQELALSPLITIENHTNTHANATQCNEHEFLEEVKLASESISQWTGRLPQMLCYPFGKWNPDVDRLLASSQLKSSVTSDAFWLNVEQQESPWRIPRILIADNRLLAEGTCRIMRCFRPF
jgi:poly-beta-1,6-N-acetyl-D-glucosamine N-deacetylase